MIILKLNANILNLNLKVLTIKINNNIIFFKTFTWLKSLFLLLEKNYFYISISISTYISLQSNQYKT